MFADAEIYKAAVWKVALLTKVLYADFLSNKTKSFRMHEIFFSLRCENSNVEINVKGCESNNFKTAKCTALLHAVKTILNHTKSEKRSSPRH